MGRKKRLSLWQESCFIFSMPCCSEVRSIRHRYQLIKQLNRSFFSCHAIGDGLFFESSLAVLIRANHPRQLLFIYRAVPSDV